MNLFWDIFDSILNVFKLLLDIGLELRLLVHTILQTSCHETTPVRSRPPFSLSYHTQRGNIKMINTISSTQPPSQGEEPSSSPGSETQIKRGGLSRGQTTLSTRN